MPMDRRNFLAMGGLAAVTATAGARAADAAGKPQAGQSPPDQMLMRRIPSSGETLPAIGLGTSGPFEVGADESARAPLREVLQSFFSAGATLIDTSPMYSTAEAVLGDLLSSAQQAKAFIATKVWTPGSGGRGEQKGVEQMQRSMALAQAQSRRAHAGSQPRGSGRPPEDAAALEGRGPHQVHGRDALHHQLLSRSHRTHRARETRLRAVQLFGGDARSGEEAAAAVRGQGRRGAHQPRVRRRQPVREGAGQAAAAPGRPTSARKAGRRYS